MDENTKSKWLAMDLWSEEEAAWLLCGVDYPGGGAPSTKEFNEASEAITRARISKRLRAECPVDASAGDRLYGHAHFFAPYDLIQWAGKRFPKFPFEAGDIEIPASSPPPISGNPLTTTDRDHVSGKLATLNQAAAWFWANADREDRGTHPKNADVVAWLTRCGYSQTLAEKAVSIIRPEWAPTGRKPED